MSEYLEEVIASQNSKQTNRKVVIINSRKNKKGIIIKVRDVAELE